MTDKRQSNALHLAGIADDGAWTFVIGVRKEIAAELLRQYAEIETLRTGYEAARLEIESLNAQLAAKPPAQPEVVPECHYGPLRDADAEWGKQLSVYATLPKAADTQQTPAQAAPAYKDSTSELHIGDSAFESWYNSYIPAHKSDKQRARDAYAAGIGDPLVTAAPQQEPSCTSVQLAEMVLSDCGHSSSNTPLLNRVAARIDWYVERCLESKKTTQHEAQKPTAVVVPCHTPSGKRVALYSAKQDLPIGTQLYTALQPSPAVQGDALDAARYRWLREGNDAKHGAAWHVAVNLYGCEWDAAIDAALAAQEGR